MPNETAYQQFLRYNPYPREMKTYAQQGLLNFSSSDYLGLAKHPYLIEKSHQYAKHWGVGTGSSRLVTGNYALFNAIEDQLATLLGKQAAIIFHSGYQTNLSVLEALLDPGVLGEKAIVFTDKYAHASLLGMTQHLADLKRFRHNDLTHLKQLLEKYENTTRPKFIIVESIYSMEGDQADLAALIALAKAHHALLYVDDAHAVGIYGEKGMGIASHYANDIDIIMGTFSKGLGSVGGYIACSSVIKQYLVNKCRGLIYSTSPSPAVLGAMMGALEIVPQLSDIRTQVLQHADHVRIALKKMNLNTGYSNTHIIPWIIGNAEEACRMSQQLEAQGILAISIRPPSVPAGKSRIRFCITANHTEQNIEQLITAVKICSANLVSLRDIET